MFPNSPNVKLKLLTLVLVQNSIGSSIYQLQHSKEVIGINFSIRSNEYYESKRSDIKIDLALKIQSFLYDNSKYAEIDDDIYKIERTYQIGQFIELYLSKTKLRKSDIIDYA
ncbi:MAG TPA: hypothetical protein P5091_05735 [Acholeplasmataceae bacterium]|nr:hypothetical protein [Acholeplasmataceae bacterium]